MQIMFLFLVLNSFPIVYNRAKQYNKLHSHIFDELGQNVINLTIAFHFMD